MKLLGNFELTHVHQHMALCAPADPHAGPITSAGAGKKKKKKKGKEGKTVRVGENKMSGYDHR